MLIPVVEDPSGTPVTKKMTVSQLLSLDSGTHSSSSPLLDMAQTWNSSGTTFTALKFNVAATAAAADSLLLDIQVGGTSKFKVKHDGLATATAMALGAGSASVPSLTLGDADTGIYAHTTGGVAIASQGALAMRIHSDGSFSAYGPYLLFSSDLIIGDAADVSLARVGIATAGFKNYASPTSPVTLQVYNTYTDGSNYERGVFDWGTTSNVLTIGTQKAGTGQTRGINFVAGGSTALQINSSANAVVTNSLYVGFGINIGSSNEVNITHTADGVLRLRDAAGTSFNRIQFGGTTSSFPAIKRDGAGLKFVVADDSASADIECLSLKTGAPNGGTAAKWKGGVLVTAAVTPDTTRYIELDVAGTLYKVIVST